MNRHDRRAAAAKTRQVAVPAAALPRVMGLLDAFHAAPNDADIEIRICASSEGEAGIMVTISGGGDHVLTCREARKLATVMEDAMRTHPNDPESHTLPNIIMGLREASDRAEQSAS